MLSRLFAQDLPCRVAFRGLGRLALALGAWTLAATATVRADCPKGQQWAYGYCLPDNVVAYVTCVAKTTQGRLRIETGKERETAEGSRYQGQLGIGVRLVGGNLDVDVSDTKTTAGVDRRVQEFDPQVVKVCGQINQPKKQPERFKPVQDRRLAMRVVTEVGDPITSAQVYSAGTVLGQTQVDGTFCVPIPAASDQIDVTIAAAGYRTTYLWVATQKAGTCAGPTQVALKALPRETTASTSATTPPAAPTPPAPPPAQEHVSICAVDAGTQQRIGNVRIFRSGTNLGLSQPDGCRCFDYEGVSPSVEMTLLHENYVNTTRKIPITTSCDDHTDVELKPKSKLGSTQRETPKSTQRETPNEPVHAWWRYAPPVGLALVSVGLGVTSLALRENYADDFNGDPMCGTELPEYGNNHCADLNNRVDTWTAVAIGSGVALVGAAVWTVLLVNADVGSPETRAATACATSLDLRGSIALTCRARF